MLQRVPFPLTLLVAAWRHLCRAFSWDLQRIPVAESERAQLLKRGVHADPLHRFAVWRRSMLFVVLGPTLLAAVLTTIDIVNQVDERLSHAGAALAVLCTVIIWAMPVSAFLAFWSWAAIRWSHRILIAGWFASFVPPFLIALVPLDWWFAMSGTPEEQEQRRLELAVLDVINGLYVAFALLPTALSVLPGMVRACVRVKMLLPAAILPGWFLMVGPPFYLLLGFVALIALNHLAGSPLLILGLVFAMGSPMLYVWRADLFVRPLRATECPAINWVTWAARLVAALGIVLLVVYLFTKKVFGLQLVGWDQETCLVWLLENQSEGSFNLTETLAQVRALYWVGDISLFQVFVQYSGRSLFMTTVFADLLVRMSHSVWGQERRFAATDEAVAYDAAMSDLSRALTSK